MRRITLLAIPVLLGAYSVMSHTSPEAIETVAQEEPVVEDFQTEEVSNEELKLYIDVYSAMQQDHSVTLEEAIQGHNVTLEEFRNIERRVQSKSRLVEKVRMALVDQAKRRSAFTDPLTTADKPATSKTTEKTEKKTGKKP